MRAEETDDVGFHTHTRAGSSLSHDDDDNATTPRTLIHLSNHLLLVFATNTLPVLVGLNLWNLAYDSILP